MKKRELNLMKKSKRWIRSISQTLRRKTEKILESWKSRKSLSRRSRMMISRDLKNSSNRCKLRRSSLTIRCSISRTSTLFVWMISRMIISLPFKRNKRSTHS